MTRRTNNDHPIHDLLATRWSPRAFSDEPVSSEALHSLLEAARWAPSSSNHQPWRFIVGTLDNPEGHARILSGLMEGNQIWASKAPVLIITAARRVTDKGRPNGHAWHDLGLAVAQLTVQATSMGLHVHQMGGIKPDELRAALEIPEEFDVVTGIAIGHLGDPDALPENLANRERTPGTRKPLAEIAFAGKWGEGL